MHDSSLPVQKTMEIITQALGTDKGTQNYENIFGNELKTSLLNQISICNLRV